MPLSVIILFDETHRAESNKNIFTDGTATTTNLSIDYWEVVHFRWKFAIKWAYYCDAWAVLRMFW